VAPAAAEQIYKAASTPVRHWIVILNGRNFWLDFDGASKRVGFFTTRCVNAPDAEKAELAAVQLVRSDAKLQGILNDPSDPPMIHLDQIRELSDPDSDFANTGYSFYVEDPDA
jgi:hypothetical protein